MVARVMAVISRLADAPLGAWENLSGNHKVQTNPVATRFFGNNPENRYGFSDRSKQCRDVSESRPHRERKQAYPAVSVVAAACAAP